MNPLAGRHVVLGVSGGIACYKSCTLARRLTEAGAAVDVVMTASATQFIRPLTFEALTGRPVVTSLWDPDHALDHVRLGRESDLIVVAPATAHLIARVAQGLADDFLTSLLLARRAPLLLCPAMNDAMYAHAETQANLRKLGVGGRGSAAGEATDPRPPTPVFILGPATGPLARGEGEGPGRMVEPEEIYAHVERLLLGAAPWRGRRVVVTAGPTLEPLDPVRVVSNRSTGKMGYEIARAAWRRGADVTLISGPTTLAPVTGAQLVRVETTDQMQQAVRAALPGADVLVMAAAPADWRPVQAETSKRKRSGGPLAVDLEPTADILSGTVAARKHGAIIVGFALESGDPVPAAREKLAAKKLDVVVANDATEHGAGPAGDTNKVTIVTKSDAEALPLLSKADVADRVLDRVAALLR